MKHWLYTLTGQYGVHANLRTTTTIIQALGLWLHARMNDMWSIDCVVQDHTKGVKISELIQLPTTKPTPNRRVISLFRLNAPVNSIPPPTQNQGVFIGEARPRVGHLTFL